MSTEKTLVQIIKTGLYIALLMPFVYINTSIFPFVVGKFIFFQVLTEILLVFYLILISINQAYRPEKSLIAIFMAFHLLAWVASGIFGISPLRSFFGNFERMSGIFNYAHFVVYFFIAAAVLRQRRGWIAYLVFALVVSTTQSFIAIAQFYSTKPILFAEPHGRVWGTLGNYIYLAGYTMTHAFLGLFVLPFVKKKEWRWPIVLMIAINIFAFFLAKTRGAYMGLLVGTLVSLIYLGWTTQNKKMRATIVVLLVAGALLGTWIRLSPDTPYKIPVIRVFKHISLNEGRTRLIAWEIAVEGFLAKPIIGWGPDNFYYVFNKFYKPRSLLNSYYETWFDRSHNIFLDELATTGAVGMIAYVGLAVVLFMGVHQLKKKYNLNHLSIAALYGLLSSYYVANVFVFDNAASFLTFALMAALIASFSSPEIPQSSERIKISKSFAVLLIVAATSVIYLYSLRPFMLAQGVLYAESAVQTGMVQAMPLYRKALERGGPLSDEVLAALLRVATERAENDLKSNKTSLADMEAIYALSKDLIKYRPKDVYTWMNLAQLATTLGQYKPVYYNEAEEYYKKALEFSPKRQQIFYAWVKTKVMENDFPGAFALLDQVEQLEPRVPDTYWYRGLLLSDIGHDNEAMEEMFKARQYHYVWKSSNEPLILAQRLEKLGRYQELPDILLEANQLSGDNPDLLLILAKSYLRINDTANGKKYLLKVLDLNPTNAEAMALLRSLGT